ncbi:hypothetical protein SAMN05192563_1004154 [Paraburkholderia aspalathi]|uniref:Transposase n=1 Tax=Paraburkholderia aspalathi TaxID=1324617 RepID=A0A1I7B3X2_9BURK|nr:hypothetical protein SAMN05192563_1004154 [Paraburkholderia aspalathi]
MKRQKKPAPDDERAKLEQQVESLRRDSRQLQLEHDILKKANELKKMTANLRGRNISMSLALDSIAVRRSGRGQQLWLRH